MFPLKILRDRKPYSPDTLHPEANHNRMMKFALYVYSFDKKSMTKSHALGVIPK